MFDLDWQRIKASTLPDIYGLSVVEKGAVIYRGDIIYDTSRVIIASFPKEEKSQAIIKNLVKGGAALEFDIASAVDRSYLLILNSDIISAVNNKLGAAEIEAVYRLAQHPEYWVLSGEHDVALAVTQRFKQSVYAPALERNDYSLFSKLLSESPDGLSERYQLFGQPELTAQIRQAVITHEQTKAAIDYILRHLATRENGTVNTLIADDPG